jgi:hypothetical protein
MTEDTWYVTDPETVQWNELMATQSGNNVTMHIEPRGEKWIIIEFDNLNIP